MGERKSPFDNRLIRDLSIEREALFVPGRSQFITWSISALRLLDAHEKTDAIWSLQNQLIPWLTV